MMDLKTAIQIFEDALLRGERLDLSFSLYVYKSQPEISYTVREIGADGILASGLPRYSFEDAIIAAAESYQRKRKAVQP